MSRFSDTIAMLGEYDIGAGGPTVDDGTGGGKYQLYQFVFSLV